MNLAGNMDNYMVIRGVRRRADAMSESDCNRDEGEAALTMRRPHRMTSVNLRPPATWGKELGGDQYE